jgi:PPOX class probable FMN-dependent enzyme
MAAMTHPPHTIGSLAQLEALLGPLSPASVYKEISHVHPLYQQMIKASPFAVLATVGGEELDVSPRGDPPGFVEVLGETTLLLPERRGNNRADSLRNIVADPRVALLFLIPGVGETLRVNGLASLSIAPDLLQRFKVNDKLPTCVIVIQVQTVFFQCARAMQRSGLWNPRPTAERPVPTPGTILSALSASFDGEAYDRELPERQRNTLY